MKLQLSEIIDIIYEVVQTGPVIYNDKMLNIQVENDVIKIYNSYYFKEHLKRAGFIWDDENKAWIGDVQNLTYMDKNILKRMLQSTNPRGIRNLCYSIMQQK